MCAENNIYIDNIKTIFTSFSRNTAHSFNCALHILVDVMQNNVISTQILAKIYRSWLKECDHHKIQQYSGQN